MNIQVEEPTPASYLGTETAPIPLGRVVSVPLLALEQPKQRRVRPKHLRPLVKVSRDPLQPTPIAARSHVGNVAVELSWGTSRGTKRLAVATLMLAVNTVLFAGWALLYLETLS